MWHVVSFLVVSCWLHLQRTKATVKNAANQSCGVNCCHCVRIIRPHLERAQGWRAFFNLAKSVM